MRRNTILAMALTTLLMSCCQGFNDGRPPTTQYKYEIIGVGGASKVDKTKYGFVNLEKSSTDSKDLKRKLHPSNTGASGKLGEIIVTDKIVKLNVSEKGTNPLHEFEALLGPGFGGGGTAKARLHKTAPAVYLSEGWVYSEGTRPISETDWVKAAADGTTMAVQIVSSSLERVYFLGPAGSQVNVYCCTSHDANGECSAYNSTLLVTLSTPDTFVDITPTSCPSSPPTPQKIPGATGHPNDPGDFIKTVRDIVYEAK